jgi:hypothetical protein
MMKNKFTRGGRWLSGVITLTLMTTIGPASSEEFLGHPLVLDSQGNILPWYAPNDPGQSYHQFLTKRWSFIKNGNFPDPQHPTYQQYYLQSGFNTKDAFDGKGINPDNWENCISESMPNWFESARLYYAYSGDVSVMAFAKGLIDYSLVHAINPGSSTWPWPNCPETGGDSGEIDVRGFTKNGFKTHEALVGYIGDMGLTYFRMYQYSGETKYLNAAIKIADTLAAKARVGNGTKSVWPYSVVMDTGEIRYEYGANFMGCYDLLNHLIIADLGNVAAYTQARTKCRDFFLNYPMKTGYWADGHPDVINIGNTYRSNTPKSNVALYMLDHPSFDPNFSANLPA